MFKVYTKQSRSKGSLDNERVERSGRRERRMEVLYGTGGGVVLVLTGRGGRAEQVC